ncbi:MAG: hypothetical protein KBF13_05405 [Prevotella sp.]|nr:hypothetical protein [Prevotella sp.]
MVQTEANSVILFIDSIVMGKFNVIYFVNVSHEPDLSIRAPMDFYFYRIKTGHRRWLQIKKNG